MVQRQKLYLKFKNLALSSMPESVIMQLDGIFVINIGLFFYYNN